MSRWCRGCTRAEQEIAYLRAQLAAAAVREQAALDRLLAVVDRTALAAVVEARNPEPPRTWATDETGTSVMTSRGERDVVFDDGGEPCVQVDGTLVKLSEWDHWMSRLSQEATGMSPGQHDG